MQKKMEQEEISSGIANHVSSEHGTRRMNHLCMYIYVIQRLHIVQPLYNFNHISFTDDTIQPQRPVRSKQISKGIELSLS